MTPYRSAPIEGRVADPSRARFGLAGAAVGSIACFIALARLALHDFNRTDSVLLFGGSAAIVVMLAYSALDAPAGRSVLYAALAVFAFSFVPQLVAKSLMGSWVWSVRYFGVAGIAVGLLLRLRRTRPGSYGAMLRLAAITAAWWGAQWIVALAWPDAQHSQRAEFFSRITYLFLAIGLFDMRRWVGAPPVTAPTRTEMDHAREIATTRVCLALVSLGAMVTASPCAWHSEWAVIATAQQVSIAVTIALHVPWLLRVRASDAAVVSCAASVFALVLSWRAFDNRSLALYAAISWALAAIATDAAVARFARSTKTRATFNLSLGAIALQLVLVATTLAVWSSERHLLP